MNILENTTIILIETSHPGNIGSVARFMKNMGFENLALVNPLCEVNNLSMALSSNAKSIVENAEIYNTLDEALASFNCVIGTTARNRGIPARIFSPANILDQLNKDNKWKEIEFFKSDYIASKDVNAWLGLYEVIK